MGLSEIVFIFSKESPIKPVWVASLHSGLWSPLKKLVYRSPGYRLAVPINIGQLTIHIGIIHYLGQLSSHESR